MHTKLRELESASLFPTITCQTLQSKINTNTEEIYQWCFIIDLKRVISNNENMATFCILVIVMNMSIQGSEFFKKILKKCIPNVVCLYIYMQQVEILNYVILCYPYIKLMAVKIITPLYYYDTVLFSFTYKLIEADLFIIQFYSLIIGLYNRSTSQC